MGLYNLYGDDIGMYVTPEMYGAVGDGIADDTNAVRSALNKGGLVLLNGTYRCTSTLGIFKSDTYIDGIGTIIGDFSPSGSVLAIWINDSSVRNHIRIKNISIRSGSAGTHNGITYRMESDSDDIFTDVLIDGVNIDGVTGNGIHLHGGGINSDTARLYFNILNCHIQNVGGIGICESHVSSRIQKCFVSESVLENITVDNGCYRTIVSDNILLNHNGGAGNISIDECESCIVANNQIINHSLADFNSNYNCGVNANCETGDVPNLIVVGNIIKNGKYGIRLGNISAGYKGGGIFTNNIFDSISSSSIYQINTDVCVIDNNIPIAS